MTGDQAAPAELILDLSRLLSRVRHRTPTGVDRVEHAYARELLRLVPDRLAFAALHPLARYGRLPHDQVLEFLAQTEAMWTAGGDAPATALHALWRLRPRPIPAPTRRRVLIQSSPHHLDRPATMRAILQRERAKLVCLVHDLIPITFPEYARPGGATLHRRRMATIAECAAGVITNSRETRATLLAHLGDQAIPVEAAHLGLSTPTVPTNTEYPVFADRPYFVCVGTIEPRKNHLLLLNIWRHLAATMDPTQVPRLVIIGRRGWENEQVIDMLERCPALADHVVELGRVPDAVMNAVLTGARALLLPSFGEGFGMPVPEAISLKVPVLCSDLLALREAGGNVPDYLDPLDGPAWIDAIHAYAGPEVSRRDAQLKRMAAWRAPTWHDHLTGVIRLADEVA